MMNDGIMDISICIVSWNVRDLLNGCLASIREAGSAIQLEVIVVDNDSRDGTAEMVEADFPEVRLLRNRVNSGFAAASNRALEESQGRYLLLLNPDTRVLPGSLEGMVAFLDGRPEAGGGGCRLLNPDGSLQESVRAFPTYCSSLAQFTILGDLGFFRKARQEYFMEGFDYTREAVVDQPMGAALFLRREAVEELGGMDDSFFIYFEDVDLCYRLAAAGRPLWYNPAASITHFGGESTGQAGGEATYWLLRSQMLYFRKNRGPGSARWFGLVFKIFLIPGLLWGIVRDGISLLGKRISAASPERIEKTAARLRKKCDFLNGYLLKFLFRG